VHIEMISARHLTNLINKVYFFPSKNRLNLNPSNLAEQPKKNNCLVKKAITSYFLLRKTLLLQILQTALLSCIRLTAKKHLYNSTIDALFQTLDEKTFFQIIAVRLSI